MALFRLKTYTEIISAMFNTARAQLGVGVDLNPGSWLRTILEAASLQDADQYVQLSKLLTLFGLVNLRGDDLDRRTAEFGSQFKLDLKRVPARQSKTPVTVLDTDYDAVATSLEEGVTVGSYAFIVASGTGGGFPVSSRVTLDRGSDHEEIVYAVRGGDTFSVYLSKPFAYGHVVGGTVELMAIGSVLSGAVLTSATTFSVSGGGDAFPDSGSLILGRETLQRELLDYTRSGNDFTITTGGGAAFAHALGDSVILSTVGSDRLITSDTEVLAPATEVSTEIAATLDTDVTLFDGDYQTSLVMATSREVGSATRATTGQISAFRSPPFPTAVPYNPLPSTQGNDREEDLVYIDRVQALIQGLGGFTQVSMAAKVINIVDPVTQQIVTYSELVDAVAPGVSELYVSDGSGTFDAPATAVSGDKMLISSASGGDKRAKLPGKAPYQVSATPGTITPRIFKSVYSGTSTGNGAGYIDDSTKSWTVNALTGYVIKVSDNRLLTILSNTTTRIQFDGAVVAPSGPYAVFNFDVNPLIPGTDYVFNDTVGDLELITALAQYDALIASDRAIGGTFSGLGAYQQGSGLITHVQKVVNGDPTDLQTYPGMKPPGVAIRVKAPIVVSPNFVVRAVPRSGVLDETFKKAVKGAAQKYVNSLGMGVTILISDIITQVKETVTNLYDVQVLSPTTNVAVLAGQMPRITDENITVI